MRNHSTLFLFDGTCFERLFLLGLLLTLTFASLTVRAESETKLAPYGFVKFGYVGASHAMDSFGYTNLSAPTVVHPNDGLDPNEYRSSFQVQQSRFGTWIQADDKVKGQFEVDFINFATASPTTGSRPRLRIAKIVYTFNSEHEFTFGQDWDIFNQSKPFTFNIVGLYFQAGNAGFMRQQAKWKMKLNDDLTLVTALGLPGKNETSADSDLEFGKAPSLSSALTRALTGGSYIGIAGIVSDLRMSSSVGSQLQPMYGGNIYGNIKFSSETELTSHVFYGQNLANTGMLTLAMGSYGQNLHEWGGFATMNHKACDRLTVFGGFGLDQVVESSGSSISNGVGNRILGNKIIALGAKYNATSRLAFYIEDSEFWTSYRGTSTEANLTVAGNMIEVGAYFDF